MQPSSASSPANRCRSSALGSTMPAAASTPSAMGRSKPVPSFRMSAGARFTVTFFEGSSKPQFLMADATRTLLSLTALSGKPTRAKKGRPSAMSTSTSTMTASTPISAPDRTVASIVPPLTRPPAAVGCSRCASDIAAGEPKPRSWRACCDGTSFCSVRRQAWNGPVHRPLRGPAVRRPATGAATSRVDPGIVRGSRGPNAARALRDRRSRRSTAEACFGLRTYACAHSNTARRQRHRATIQPHDPSGRGEP